MFTTAPLISRSIIEIATCLVFRNVPAPATADRPVPELEALLEHSPAAEHGGVVDQDVDPSPRIEHLADVTQHVVLGAHVTDGRHRRTSVALDPPHRRPRRLGIEVVARDARAVPGQRQRDPAADVRTGAGYQRHLAIKRDLHGYARPSMITLLTWV